MGNIWDHIRTHILVISLLLFGIGCILITKYYDAGYSFQLYQVNITIKDNGFEKYKRLTDEFSREADLKHVSAVNQSTDKNSTYVIEMFVHDRFEYYGKWIAIEFYYKFIDETIYIKIWGGNSQYNLRIIRSLKQKLEKEFANKIVNFCSDYKFVGNPIEEICVDQ